MAVFSAILIPGGAGATKVAALASGTSSAETLVGQNQIFAINATKDITVKFGVAGMSAAAATDFRVPANSTMTFDMGHPFTHVRVFNLDAAAVDVYILPLCRN
jgi:hypothetical protein